MALTSELPIYVDTFNFVLELLKDDKQLPREYKPTLGRKILDVALDLFSYVQNANRNTDPKKREYYKVKFLTDFEVVKTYIRLEHDLKLINDKKYAYYIRIMDSIGKQMTAWKNREK